MKLNATQRKLYAGPSGCTLICKEAVGNSWDILYAILGHMHHQSSKTRPYEANFGTNTMP